MKILLLGANGQVGWELQRSLAPLGQMKACDRHALDLGNFEGLRACTRDYRPEIIVNAAAYTAVEKAESEQDKACRINAKAVALLADEAKQLNAWFIHYSTDYVFDGNNGPYTEDDHTFPVNYYGKTKLEAENMLRGMRRRFLIFRPNVLYGEDIFSKGNFFAWVYKSLLNGKSISVVTDQISNPVYVQNFVNAIFKCIIMNCEGIYHFGSDDYISRYEFARNIAQIFNFELSLVEPIETKTLTQKVKSYIAKRPINSGLKTVKIEQEVNQEIYSTLYSLKQLKNNLALT